MVSGLTKAPCMAWPQAPWPFPNLPTYFGMSWLRRIAIVCVGVGLS